MIVEEALSDEDFHSAEEDNGPAPVQIQEVPEDEFVEGRFDFPISSPHFFKSSLQTIKPKRRKRLNTYISQHASTSIFVYSH